MGLTLSGLSYHLSKLSRSLWYGAYVGDLFMSLIYTCPLNGANPFDYLTTLQKHKSRLSG